MSRSGAAILAFLAAGVLGACAPRQPFGAHPYADPWDLLEAVRARQAAPTALEGDARIRVHTDQGTFGADHFVALAVPGALRLETLSFFGDPLALTLVQDGSLLIWDLHSGRAWTGPASARSLGLVAPVGLGPEEVIDVLRGVPPLLPTDDVTLELDHRARRYRLVLSRGAERQELVVHPEELVVEEVRWMSGREVLRRLTYDRYRAAGSGRFPYGLHYEAADGAWVEVSWREVTLDPELDPGLFQVELPPGLPVAPLDVAASVEERLPVAPEDPADGPR